MSEPRTAAVVLILADISGYTRFMLANQMASVHGQVIISLLLEEIIREVEIPLEVKEIEGDAVFMYALKPDGDEAWDETRALIGRKLAGLFEAFARGIVAGSEFALCSCPSCQNVDQLRLKVVVHCGEAVVHEVDRFSELSGVDVILAHRLLKNSVPSDEYVLMTEAAYREIRFETDSEPVRGQEHYEGFGTIPTYTYLLDGSSTPSEAGVDALYADRGQAFTTALRFEILGFFSQLSLLFGLRPQAAYRDVDSLPGSRASRLVLGLAMLFLAPLYLPYGTLVQASRVWQRRTRAQRKARLAS